MLDDRLGGLLLATLFLLFGIVASVQWRFRRLVRERANAHGEPAPTRIWGASPGASWTFVRQLLRRDHAHLDEPRLRRWGDLLLFVYAIYAAVLAAIAGLLFFRR